MDQVIKIKIRDLNPHVVCSLCAGYFIEATTITECLHTFCKSCVVKFLQTSKCCPQCGQKVHETQPLLNLKPDRVLQDIIFKLIPRLYENEEKRIEDFYGPSPQSSSSSSSLKELKDGESISSQTGLEHLNQFGHLFINDKTLCFCFERYSCSKSCDDSRKECDQLLNKFVRCSERACLVHIKSLLGSRLNVDPCNLDIVTSSGRALSDWTTVKQVWLMCAPQSVVPFTLYYRKKESSS